MNPAVNRPAKAMHMVKASGLKRTGAEAHEERRAEVILNSTYFPFFFSFSWTSFSFSWKSTGWQWLADAVVGFGLLVLGCWFWVAGSFRWFIQEDLYCKYKSFSLI